MNISQKYSILKHLNKTTKTAIHFSALIFMLILGFFLSLKLGSADVSLLEAINDARSGNLSSIAFRIVFYIRLPRLIGAILAGAALAVSGVIIQAVLLNPMAAPNIIGVNAGAGFAAILLISIFPASLSLLPFAAFIGALISCIVIYLIARITDASRITITLVGIAIGSILTAGINTIKTLFPDSVYDANFFLIGGLSGVGYEDLFPAGYMILAGLIAAILTAKETDLLSLGDDTAKSLGLSVTKWRFLMLIIAAILAGSAVSFAGLIGFIGLIVPHVMRRLVGSGHKTLIPLSALGGAAFLLYADLFSRLLFAPYELPAGILLSLVGGIFFIFLILFRRRRND